nr:RNA-directed DNA polymerase, eukaryota [Tanacetum cinerariifolium]
MQTQTSPEEIKQIRNNEAKVPNRFKRPGTSSLTTNSLTISSPTTSSRASSSASSPTRSPTSSLTCTRHELEGNKDFLAIQANYSSCVPYKKAKNKKKSKYIKEITFQHRLSTKSDVITGGLDHQGCNFNDTWSRIVGSSNFLHSKDIIPLNSFRFKVGCGTRIRFWKDMWIGDSPLHIRYNMLYRLEQDKDCFIIDRIVNGRWHWNWSRADIGIQNMAYLRELFLEISRVDLNSEDDTCIWSMVDDGVFSGREQPPTLLLKEGKVEIL